MKAPRCLVLFCFVVLYVFFIIIFASLLNAPNRAENSSTSVKHLKQAAATERMG